MKMRKTVTICEEQLTEICDIINEELNKSADKVLSELGINKMVHTTTRHYKELLINVLFKEGEENNGERTENTRYTET